MFPSKSGSVYLCMPNGWHLWTVKPHVETSPMLHKGKKNPAIWKITGDDVQSTVQDTLNSLLHSMKQCLAPVLMNMLTTNLNTSLLCSGLCFSASFIASFCVHLASSVSLVMIVLMR
uniref:Uncharacterized protein n=1 Tax=Rhipicephalus microplus TaxID=6941 RepID=A0A6G5AFH3_RHIMP